MEFWWFSYCWSFRCTSPYSLHMRQWTTSAAVTVCCRYVFHLTILWSNGCTSSSSTTHYWTDLFLTGFGWTVDANASCNVACWCGVTATAAGGTRLTHLFLVKWGLLLLVSSLVAVHIRLYHYWLPMDVTACEFRLYPLLSQQHINAQLQLNANVSEWKHWWFGYGCLLQVVLHLHLPFGPMVPTFYCLLTGMLQVTYSYYHYWCQRLYFFLVSTTTYEPACIAASATAGF